MELTKLEQYGKTEMPIQGTRAYAKEFGNFSQDGMSPVSWIIVNEVNGTYTSVNLYDGKAGDGYDADRQTYPLKPASASKWAKKGYTEADIDECQVAEVIEISTG
jgi:hypothetical protein